MGLHAHGGTREPWHNQGLSLTEYSNPTAEIHCLDYADDDGEYHCAWIQISEAYGVGQRSSQATPPNKASASGLGDPPDFSELN